MKEKPFSAYSIVTNIIMILVVVMVVLPFLLLFSSSLTEENTLVAYGYSFFPRKFSAASYGYILQSGKLILKAYGVSILITALGTLLHVLLAALMAYPLAIKNLPGRNILSFYVFFTMLFNGGIVPSYLMWSGTFHIKDTLFAQLLPNLLLSAWNVMMIRTYFTTSIPDALYEAAEIDGASQFTIFSKIVLPLGKPILVTMGTFAGLGYWNDWTNFVEGEDDGNYKYHQNSGWSLGNQFQSYVWNNGTKDKDYWNKLQHHNDWAQYSPAYGFMWDASNYQTQITALQNALETYRPALETGSVGGAANVESTLKALNDALYAAGLQEVMDAKQAQLDEWLTNNGGATKTPENNLKTIAGGEGVVKN